MNQQPQILMCPPDYYGIHYEINPWMNRRRQADHDLAVSQWNALHTLLTQCGVRTWQLVPQPGLPDLVFTANAALIFRDSAVLSRFRHPQRQGEEQHDAAWLAEHGLQVLRLPETMYFEGAGDALFCGDTLLAGYRIRSDARALQHVGQLVQRRVIPLELVDPYFYHLDTCFCPLTESTAIYYPGAFDTYGKTVLNELIDELIEVPAEEARQFACNAVVVGHRVIANVGCPRLHAELTARGFEVLHTPLSEFVKAGGSAKCLTLRLDGEEAVAWKRQDQDRVARQTPSP